jgi:hypothetical protein
MASLDSFLMGRISGKLGDKVYYQMKGKTYVRSLPASKTKTVTALQLMNQHRFLCILQHSRKFKYSVIPLIWNDRAKTTSGFGLFMKTNGPAFGKDGLLIDPQMLHLSAGKLYNPDEFTAKRKDGEPTIVEVSWQKDGHLGGLPLWDELMAVSTDNDQYSDVIVTGITRHNLGGSFTLPASEAPATHLYLFFASNR